jgi:hypothetical protein
MSKLLLASTLVLCWTFIPRQVFAETKCPAGDAPIFEEDVRATPSCEAAHKLHDACAWGSSGDAGLSGAVIEKAKPCFWIASLRRRRETTRPVSNAAATNMREKMGAWRSRRRLSAPRRSPFPSPGTPPLPAGSQRRRLRR